MSKVTIEDGKVIDVTEPKVKYCPLFKKHRGIDELNCESVRKNAEFRIERFGMCNDNRDTRMKDFLSFGVSEMLSLALTEHLIDAAVIAADGPGGSGDRTGHGRTHIRHNRDRTHPEGSG